MMRADFVREVEQSRAVQQRLERRLAYFAVPGGLGQLALHRWLDATYGKGNTTSIGLTVFLIYISIFIVMFAHVIRNERAVTPKCPSCGQRFSKMSASLAITTGRCDRCGAQVVE
jgi:DNA-directed RNA polymerase subunit RPC12/RpoP